MKINFRHLPLSYTLFLSDWVLTGPQFLLCQLMKSTQDANPCQTFQHGVCTVDYTASACRYCYPIAGASVDYWWSCMSKLKYPYWKSSDAGCSVSYCIIYGSDLSYLFKTRDLAHSKNAVKYQRVTTVLPELSCRLKNWFTFVFRTDGLSVCLQCCFLKKRKAALWTMVIYMCVCVFFPRCVWRHRNRKSKHLKIEKWLVFRYYILKGNASNSKNGKGLCQLFLK